MQSIKESFSAQMETAMEDGRITVPGSALTVGTGGIYKGSGEIPADTIADMLGTTTIRNQSKGMAFTMDYNLAGFITNAMFFQQTGRNPLLTLLLSMGDYSAIGNGQDYMLFGMNDQGLGTQNGSFQQFSCPADGEGFYDLSVFSINAEDANMEFKVDSRRGTGDAVTFTHAYAGGANRGVVTLRAQNGSVDNTVVLDTTAFQIDAQYLLTETSIPEYANDAAADGDANLLVGGLYRVTGDRTVYRKP